MLARLAAWSSWCCRHGVAYHGGTVQRACAGADDRGIPPDGLADTCDGGILARSRDCMLEIMADSRLSTMAACILFLWYWQRSWR
ncbi:adenosylcobinamide-GDP ribazoletransferase [Escherichia coli]